MQSETHALHHDQRKQRGNEDKTTRWSYSAMFRIYLQEGHFGEEGWGEGKETLSLTVELHTHTRQRQRGKKRQSNVGSKIDCTSYLPQEATTWDSTRKNIFISNLEEGLGGRKQSHLWQPTLQTYPQSKLSINQSQPMLFSSYIYTHKHPYKEIEHIIIQAWKAKLSAKLFMNANYIQKFIISISQF